MPGLSSTAGIVSLAAGGVALVALALAASATLRLRRLRADQRVVIGDQNRDLVAHAAGLQRDFQTLSDYVGEVTATLDARVQEAEGRLDGAVTYRALVRYDAYGEMSGRQSTSIALLDATHSGIVLSSISHRDQARLYAKQVRQGEPELALSPEEQEAIQLALSGGPAADQFAPGDEAARTAPRGGGLRRS